jgi:hypothetical protein
MRKFKVFRLIYLFSSLFIFSSVKAGELESSDADLFALDEKALTDLRVPYAARPRPADLVFVEEAVSKYVSSLPKELQESEKKRFNIIKGAKEQIIKLFTRNSMDIKKSFRLKSGRSVSGTIALANDKVFIVRTGKARSSKSKTYKWDDLSFSAYAEILDQFAQKRLKATGGEVNIEDSKKYAANDYILLTILCDWYGEYKLSQEYAKRAVDLRPEIKDQLNDLLFK